MNVTLTPEVRKFFEQKISSGRYQSPEEAVNGLLSLVQHQEELSPENLEELRAEVDLGIDDADQGRFVEFTAEDVIAAGRVAGGEAIGMNGGADRG